MNEGSVPEWASFFTSERFEIFIERVRKALGESVGEFGLNSEAGYWSEGDEANGLIYGLVNLAQICNQLPMDDWDVQIADFIRGVRKASGGGDDAPRDFESVRPMLKVRLFATDAFDPKLILRQEVSEGFMVGLVIDLPDKVMSVAPDVARTYGMSSFDLFELGMRNVVEGTTAERMTHELSEGAVLNIFTGDDFFVASLALALDTLAGAGPDLGRLVIVPNRHQTVWVDLESAKALDALGSLVFMARGMFTEGPGSISPYVYWVRNGRWQRLEIELTDEGIGVQGPDSFVDDVLRPLLEP